MKRRGFRVAPLSKQKIREVATACRKVLGLKSTSKAEMGLIFEKFCHALGIDYDILENHDMPKNVEAQYHPGQQLLEISAKVYEDLCNLDRRAMFTIAHEFGHAALHDSCALQRSNNHAVYEDSEWQADYFAAEFLMPIEMVRACSNVEELMHKSGTSYTAAKIRFEDINSF